MVTIFAAVLYFGGSESDAATIAGSIQFGNGTLTTDTNDLATANMLFFAPGATVVGIPTGDYEGIAAGTDVIIATTLVIDPLGGSASPLWQLEFAGITYAFNLLAVTSRTQSATELTLTGVGTATSSAPGFTATPGNWILNAYSPATNEFGLTNVSFSFDATTAVPDGGQNVVLLGIGLVSVGLLAKRKTLVSRAN